MSGNFENICILEYTVVLRKMYMTFSTDDYVINGSKLWITNGLQADWICLLANTSEGPPHKNKSLICVPLELPGVQKARNISKLGMHSSDTAELFFEDVRVPQSYRIGQEGMGFVYQMLQFVEERVFAGASGTGTYLTNRGYYCIVAQRYEFCFGVNIKNNYI